MTSSRQLDIAVDLESEVDTADCDDGLCRQSFATLQLPLRVSIAHCLFDSPLGGDAALLEEFAHAGVEGFLVHDRSPSTAAPSEHASRNLQIVASNVAGSKWTETRVVETASLLATICRFREACS